jgi:hypothetical protein
MQILRFSHEDKVQRDDKRMEDRFRRLAVTAGLYQTRHAFSETMGCPALHPNACWKAAEF